MTSPADALAQVAADLRDLLSGDTLAGLSDAKRAEALAGFGEISRLADAGIVETVATADTEFGHRFGCRGMNEMLRRAALVDASVATRIIRAADAVQRETSLVSGERMPARWPAMREALLDGAVGVAGLQVHGVQHVNQGAAETVDSPHDDDVAVFGVVKELFHPGPLDRGLAPRGDIREDVALLHPGGNERVELQLRVLTRRTHTRITQKPHDLILTRKHPPRVLS